MSTDNNITVNFTYTCPDEPYVDTTANNTEVSATYNGPDTWWVFIDNETNLWTGATFTASSNGENIAAPEGLSKVTINSNDNPVLVSLIDPAGFTMITTKAAVNETITLADDTTVTHTYDYPLDPQEFIDGATTAYADDSWTWDYITAQVSWTEILEARNAMLESSDYRIADDMPDSIKQPWIDYRQALRDLPTQWQGVDTWKVEFPEEPTNS